jgi:hypothetical protein
MSNPRATLAEIAAQCRGNLPLPLVVLPAARLTAAFNSSSVMPWAARRWGSGCTCGSW